MKKPFYKRTWFIVVAILVILGSIFGGNDKEDVTSATEPIITTLASQPNAQKKIASTEIVHEFVTEPKTEAATEPETEPITEPATEPETEEVTEPETEPATEPETEEETEAEVYTVTYIGNRNTKKFHYQDCSSVSDMKESNKVWLDGGRDEAISRGYVPCKRCKP